MVIFRDTTSLVIILQRNRESSYFGSILRSFYQHSSCNTGCNVYCVLLWTLWNFIRVPDFILFSVGTTKPEFFGLIYKCRSHKYFPGCRRLSFLKVHLSERLVKTMLSSSLENHVINL